MFLRRKKNGGERQPLVWVEPDESGDALADAALPALSGFQDAPRPGPIAGHGPTVIGAGMKITGDVEAHGRLQLAGRIEGKIHVPVVEVEQAGVVVGEIHADRVTVSGIVTGRIEAIDIHLTSAAQVVGDLVCLGLQIDKGASFEGHCQRRK
jgi:cytoskeletal protein CcmA (bactofilin family)